MVTKRSIPFLPALALVIPLVLIAGSAQADIQYLDDGAVPNDRGGWDLPLQGGCPAGATFLYTGIDTRPECVALRLNVVQGSCTSGANLSWTTGGVCNDVINTNQADCEAEGDRLWNPDTGVCAVMMMDDDRNNVVCAKHGGNWVTAGTCTGSWIMPSRTSYTPTLWTGTGPGDQCLRCHNTLTQYNGPRVRDTQDTLYMGHKNMSRKVVAGEEWGGPPFDCSDPLYTIEEDCIQNGETWDPTVYPGDDAGNLINWASGEITIGGTPREMTWIYADWLSAYPRTVHKAPASTSQVCSDPRYTTANCVANGGTLLFNAGVSYSCSRCHTTGWKSEATINTAKEPEVSFPGITWDRTTDAGFGVVNLSGGVSNDPNKYASWDAWGITCTRCHNSAIDNDLVACTGLTQGTCTTLLGTWTSSSSTCSNISPADCTGNGGTIANYVAQAGTSTHHNLLTVPDISSGACTDPRWTAETQCTANNGLWLAACSINPTPGVCTYAAANSGACATATGTWNPVAGWCSNAFFTDSTSCAANAFTWQDGWCTSADAQGTCSGGSGGSAKTWRVNGTQASCQLGGGDWPFSKCNLAGFCNKGTCSDLAYANAVNCEAAGEAWTAITDKASCDTAVGQFAYATDVIRCEDAGGHWTGNHANRGQIITRLCMDCHRQETAGLPNGATSSDGVNVDYSATNPAGQIKVGPVHGSVEYTLHFHGNHFLNSPHGRFTGRFDQIATGRNGTEYDSEFQNEAEAANTGNGCTGCHEVHTSTVTGAEPFRETCVECHTSVDMATIRHLSGAGTPLEDIDHEPAEPCIVCHMPQGQHLWRVNTDPSYTPFPPTALTATVNANTLPDDGYASAVWVDVDAACGQCHGGGTSQVETTGTIGSGNLKSLAVASAAGLTVGQKVRVTGAGSPYYDDEGATYLNNDFDSYIVTIVGTTVTLAGNATRAVTNAAVVQNATRDDITYFTKAQLAEVADGMHDGAGVNYAVTFSTSVDSLTVDVNAAVDCGGSCPGLEYEWDWGDGDPPGTADPDSHTYATSGVKTITLTVMLASNGLEVGSSTRSVTLTSPDLPPVIGNSCTWDADTWTMTLLDASSDDGPDGDATAGDGDAALQIVVNWGDGSTKSIVTGAGSQLTHVYTKTPGPFTVTEQVIDTKLQHASLACATQATPSYFTISGTVYRNNGTTPLPSASVTLKKGAAVVKVVATAANGSYSFGSVKPGAYTLWVKKSGFTFALPAAAATVGPSQNIDILANAPVYASTDSRLDERERNGRGRAGDARP